MKANKEEIRDKVVNSIDMSRELEDEEIHNVIDEIIINELDCKYMTINQRCSLHKYIFHSIRGLGIIEDLLSDESVTEIMINNYKKIFIEKNGKIEEVEGQFSSEERLSDTIQRIVSKNNRRVNESTPIVDTRLEDGSRVNIVLPPIAIDGAVITIRKFPKENINMNQLIRWNAITREASDFLKKLVLAGYNIFICGGTGCGKTTFLNVLSDFIPRDERVITIEDSAELQLKSIRNLIRLEARQANIEGENEITIRSLIKTSLRMRPDRIIVGEVRGIETLDMLQAMNTGHDGSMSTGHANSPKDMLSRLETMILMGIEMPLNAIRAQIASGIDIIVYLGRLRDKSRKVIEIDEVQGYFSGEIVLNKLYEFVEYGETDGKICGQLEQTDNQLIHTDKMIKSGQIKGGENDLQNNKKGYNI